MWQCTSTRPGSTYPVSRAASTPGSVNVRRPWCTHASGSSCTSPRPPAAPAASAASASTHPVRCHAGAAISSTAEELLEAGRQVQRRGVHVLLAGQAEGGPARRLGCLRGALGRLPLLLGALGGVAGLALLLLRWRHPALGLLPGAGHRPHPRKATHPGHPAATAGHRAHHRLRLLEPLQQPVDLADRGARAAGDPGAAGTVDDLREIGRAEGRGGGGNGLSTM